MVEDIRLVSTRDPEPGELSLGRSFLQIGIDYRGERWVLKSVEDDAVGVVAYGLARLHFGGVVPLTGRVGPWVAQKYVTGKTPEQLGSSLYSLIRRNEGFIIDLGHMISLDYVLGNGDRHGNNWLVVEGAGRVVAIDNEITAENMTLKRALRPAFRSGLVTDPDLTPLLISTIESDLRAFGDLENRHSLVKPALYDLQRWRYDLKTWRSV